MSGSFPRNPIVKANGIKWNTAKSDFPQVQSEINQYGTQRYPPEKQQSSTFLTWLTPEEVKQKQIAIFNQRRGNDGDKIFERKNIGYEHEKTRLFRRPRCEHSVHERRRSACICT